MAKQTINIGTSANDRTGDPLRIAFNKANQNFTELYTNVTNNTSNITALTTEVNTPVNYNDILNTPTDVSDFTDTTNLFSSSLDNFKISGDTIGTKNNPDTGGWGAYNMYLDPGGESSAGIYIPSVSNQTGGSSLNIYNTATVNSTIQLGINGASYIFGRSELEIPYNVSIKQNSAFTRVTTPIINSNQTSAVIWTALRNSISSVKLTIQLETNQIGDTTGWHSQVCEVIIASRGYANGQPGYGEPIMTVYGVTYTSTLPLVTFTVQHNPTNSLIEIVGTRTAETSTAIDFRIHSVEMITRD